VPYEDTTSALSSGLRLVGSPGGFEGVSGGGMRRGEEHGRSGSEVDGSVVNWPFPQAHLKPTRNPPAPPKSRRALDENEYRQGGIIRSSNPLHSSWRLEPTERPFAKQRNGSSFREEFEMRSLNRDRMPEDPFVRAAMS